MLQLNVTVKSSSMNHGRNQRMKRGKQTKVMCWKDENIGKIYSPPPKKTLFLAVNSGTIPKCNDMCVIPLVVF